MLRIGEKSGIRRNVADRRIRYTEQPGRWSNQEDGERRYMEESDRLKKKVDDGQNRQKNDLLLCNMAW